MIQLIPAEEVVSISQWKEIIKVCRYEMLPSKKQDVRLNQTLSTCRRVYNDSLEERKDGWENGGWSVKYLDQQSHLTTLRNKNDEWGKELRNVYTDVEQDAIKRVDNAYDRYFGRVKNNKNNPEKYKKPGYPRYKGRNRYRSFTFTRYRYGCHILDGNKNKDINGDIIRLSKIGDIPFVRHKDIGDSGIPFIIKTITIKKEVDKWIFIPTISTFVEIEIPVNRINKEINTMEELQKELQLLNNKCVGNDMGLSNVITLSNGKKIEAQKYLYKSAKRLRKEQQKLSRKKIYYELDENGNIKRDPKTDKKLWKGSKNRDKQVIKVAKIHRRIKNQRRNFDHIESKGLVKNYDVNTFEKLLIRKMMRNRRYSKAIADSSWGQLQRFTRYKAEWAGKTADFVDPVNTSQSCSKCGRLVGKMEDKTADSMFHCPSCKISIDVHVSAGINIRNRSEVYQKMLNESIYRRLSKELKEKIRLSEEKIKKDIYCWSLEPEDSWSKNRISRDAAARIYAFGDVTTTHMETYEKVASMNKEALSKKGDESIENINTSPALYGGIVDKKFLENMI